MSMNIEIAGDALVEAVIADEAAKGGDAHAAAHGACANCGTPLTGAFCHRCGQHVHVHRSLLHLGEELLHGIFHFDTKAWRTVPLLMFRPGRLTRDFIDGKRVRYVSPLPLFLFLVFLMFVVFSLTNGGPQTPEDVQRELATTRARLTSFEARLAGLPAGDERAPDLRAEIREQRAEIKELEITLKEMEGAAAKVASPDESRKAGKYKAMVERQFAKHLPGLSGSSYERKVIHAFENQELAAYKMKSAAAKFAFLLVPISLPFLWLLLVFKRGVTMFDHAVFVLYSLSAMAVLMMTVAILGYFGFEALVAFLIMLAPPLHMYKQLRGTYSLGRFGALWRTAALLFVAACTLLLYAVAVMLLAM